MTLVVGVVAGGLSVSLLRGQADASVLDGIYTDSQAKQGDQDYHKDCASCHAMDLGGRGQAPPLKGAEFVSNWNGLTVGVLFEKIQSAMPADRPGQLSMEENAGILAYMLQVNKFPSGKNPLAADIDALKKIRFESPK